MDGVVIRRASAHDAPAVLGIFDDVIAWFVAIGNDGQWGREPWSTQPKRIALVTEACALPDAWVAEDREGRVLGALILGESMPYVPPATEPEIYVRVLVASRDVQARCAGAGCRPASDGLRGSARPGGRGGALAGGLLWRRDRRAGAFLRVVRIRANFTLRRGRVAGAVVGASFVTVHGRSHAARRLSVAPGKACRWSFHG